jgi:hypothetical protein
MDLMRLNWYDHEKEWYGFTKMGSEVDLPKRRVFQVRHYKFKYYNEIMAQERIAADVPSCPVPPLRLEESAVDGFSSFILNVNFFPQVLVLSRCKKLDLTITDRLGSTINLLFLSLGWLIPNLITGLREWCGPNNHLWLKRLSWTVANIVQGWPAIECHWSFVLGANTQIDHWTKQMVNTPLIAKEPETVSGRCRPFPSWVADAQLNHWTK